MRHIPEVARFRQSIRAGNVEQALVNAQTTKETLPVPEMSQLIELLLQRGDLEQATNCVMTLLKGGSNPVLRVFRFYLNKLALVGNVQGFQTIAALINENTKKLISFDNKLCHAYLVSGQIETYLKIVENDIDKANDSNIQILGERFPRGGAFGILEAHPEHIDKCKYFTYCKLCCRQIVSDAFSVIRLYL